MESNQNISQPSPGHIQKKPIFQHKNAHIASSIDLGTYGCRMLTGMLEKNLENGKKKIKLISKFSQTVRLNVSDSGSLPKNARARLIKSLEHCNSILTKYKVKNYRCVGTAACRSLKNPDQFIEEIKQHTNINLEIISPEEEIKLACAGAMPVFSSETPIKFVFDIGGGSTEMGIFRHERKNLFPQCIDCVSLPYGIITSQNKDKKTKERIMNIIHGEVLNLLSKCPRDSHNKIQLQAISTSGPLASIVTVDRGLRGYHGPHVHGMHISFEDADKWINKIEDLMPGQFSEKYGISHAMTFGLPMLKGILSALQTDVYISNTGVRYGILKYLLNQKHYTKQNK